MKIVVVLAALVAVFLIIAALQPATYRVERSATISAPPDVVFAQVNDFHNWAAWSPWENLDPAMKKTHEGAPSGTGAIQTWAGNSKVGEGRSTITESRANDLVRVRLDFLKPFPSIATAEYAFKPQGGGTTVTWSMNGEKAFLMKAMGLFISMDSMLGDQFEAGLANLKSVSEAAAAQRLR